MSSERQMVDFRDEGAIVTDTVLEDGVALSIMNLPVAGEHVAPSKKSASEEADEQKKAMEDKTSYDNRVPRETKMMEILEKIDDPQTAKADLARLVAWEMASLLAHIEKLKGSEGEKSLGVKNLLETLKGVRELGRQLIEADNANQDYINFDGAKFKKVMNTWFETAKEALGEIGFDDNTIKNFMMHWAEILGRVDQKLRREVQEIK